MQVSKSLQNQEQTQNYYGELFNFGAMSTAADNRNVYFCKKKLPAAEDVAWKVKALP